MFHKFLLNSGLSMYDRHMSLSRSWKWAKSGRLIDIFMLIFIRDALEVVVFHGAVCGDFVRDVFPFAFGAVLLEGEERRGRRDRRFQQLVRRLAKKEHAQFRACSKFGILESTLHLCARKAGWG